MSGIELESFPVPSVPGLECSPKASEPQPSESLAQSPSPSRVIEDTTLSLPRETPEVPFLISGTEIGVPFKEEIDLE